MKIKKIQKISNFGTFDNFQWQNNCQEFGQYNFFYGWNYSGKTTLSRIFRCLELKSQHIDFPGAEFSLETDNGKVTQRDTSRDYPIRVFNEDFVEDNFQWNNEEAKVDPVLILGKEAKELENKAKKLTKRKKDRENILKETEENKKRRERELNNYLTDKASEIRNILGITNPKEFDKNKLEEEIKTIKDSCQSYILSINAKEKILSIYRSKKAEKITFEAPQLKLSTFISEVKNILFQKATVQKIIERLKENPKLSNWVKEGIDLHKNKQVCQFCGNILSPERLEELNKHFTEEFDNLMNQIKEKGEEISDHIDKIKNLNLPDKARLFENFQSDFEKKIGSLNTIKNNYIKTLQSVNEELKRKKEKPFDSLELKKLTNKTTDLKNVFKEIEKIINTHNSKVHSFEKEKQQAKEKLIHHFVAEFIKEKRYFEFKKEIEELNNNIQILNKEIDQLNSEIDNINSQIRAAAIGADKINEYLKQFFNDDKLKVKLTDDGRYKLYRNDRIAKNLSTGEKNIISLVYFFAKLEETDFDFNNAVIFIDDPVSSLDSNHIFKVYGFINEKLKDCSQLFITTHNFDFFNLLKDSKFGLGGKERKRKVKFYFTKKVRNQEKEFSRIENLSNILLKHKSEYNYLFSILRSFDESDDKTNFELLYILPNILRRFLEGYLFMKYPDGKRFKDKAERFLKDTNISDRQKALKLMDEYSHEENPTHVQKLPDTEEVKDAVNFILRVIKDKDAGHYQALVRSLNVN